MRLYNNYFSQAFSGQIYALNSVAAPKRNVFAKAAIYIWGSYICANFRKMNMNSLCTAAAAV